MIEKIKYHLSRIVSCEQMRISCLVVMAALTVAMVTLVNSSIYTVNIFDGESNYTVRTLNNNVTSILSNVDLKSNSYRIKNTTTQDKITSIEISYYYPVKFIFVLTN